MPVTTVVVFIVAVSALAAIAEPIARLLRLPLSTVLVLIGVVAGQLVELSGFDTGFRHYHFNETVLVVLLPPLVFLAGLELDLRNLRADAGLVAAFALIGLLAAALLTAAALYYGINHPRGFPWAAALLCGAVLAATDPLPMLRALRARHAPNRVTALVEGEGLFNDAGAVVLFSMLLAFALAGDTGVGIGGVSLQFLQLVVGGGVIGAVLAGLAVLLSRVIKAGATQSMLSIATAYGTYLAAETLGCSGVIATLVAAVMLRAARGRNATEVRVNLEATWRTLAFMAQAVLFLLVGFAVTIAMFRERWLAMLIGIGAVIGARIVTVYGLVGVRNWIRPHSAIRLRDQSIVAWAGTRGAVTLVLALALPTSLPYWWTIQSIAFGVVLFSLLLQAPLTNSLLRLLIKDSPQ